MFMDGCVVLCVVGECSAVCLVIPFHQGQVALLVVWDMSASLPALEDKPTVEFHALDAQHLLEKWTGKFEVVIEKAMLDAIACGQDNRTEIQAMLHEVSRVLRPSCGVYVCVSHAPPDERFPFLVGRQGGETNVSEEYGWRVVHQIVGKPGCPLDAKGKSHGVDLPRSAAFKLEEHVYHLYVCSKS